MPYRLQFLSASSLAALALTSQPALADEVEDTENRITVIGDRVEAVPSGATGLPLAIVDTPQSVTVIDRTLIDDFAFDEVNDLLRYVTGVNVEEAETDRTYYNARGFDITEAMVDGIQLPNIWGPSIGSLDTVLWDSIEVVRGANGLLSGVGNPSGTINYRRRHYTGQKRVTAELTAASWNRVRGEVDIEMPLTSDGNWGVRLVGAAQNADSYLRDYRSNRTALQGVIDGRIADSLAVSFGYARQQGTSRGVLWGALPLLDSAGNQLDWDFSTSTTQDWTYWKSKDQTAFGEATWTFAPGWSVKTHLTRRINDEPSRLFYVYGTPDAQTGLGLMGNPGGYLSTARGWIWDNRLDGTFKLFGRDQKLTFGIQRTAARFGYLSYPVPLTDPAWAPLPPLQSGWNGSEVPYPAFGDPVESASINDKQWRIRAATDLELGDRLSLILGANYVDVKTTGFTFGVSAARSESAVSPFLGATFKIVPGVNLYASYSDIFNPQKELGTDLKPVGSAKGKSWEAGLKGETSDKALFGSLALFRSEQANLAESSGYDANLGQTLYTGIFVRSQGVEAEVGGRIAPGLTVQGGLTHLSLEGRDGNPVRTYVPRTTANLLVRWEPVEKVQLGAAMRWQDAVYSTNALGTIRQGDYATLQLQAGYRLNDNVSFNLNVANATNHKHLASLYWDQSFLAPPRSVTGSVRMTF
ncbi:outer-membrane receptor for ferric coprogen and ferric-rhodotorulic acid [Novosphingobium sp. B1]|nr:outer-membrane receptor for ferric coprogen and ferric-rhodotorulic acid [Novosphingobium sp. B1]